MGRLVSLLVLFFLVTACQPVVAPDAGTGGVAKKLGVNRMEEICVAATPGAELTYSFAASAPLAMDVHYHDDQQQVRTLVHRQGVNASQGTVTAPVATTYCLMLHNTSTAPLIVSDATLTTAESKAAAVMAHGKHDHGAMAAGMPMAAKDAPSMAGMAMAAKPEYIRVRTPAGYDAVIGAENPLTELQPELITAADGSVIKHFTLTVEDVHFEIFPGKQMMGWGFNGQIPGPTIRVREGDRIRITLVNKTDTEHSLHIHGLIKPMQADGVPYIDQQPVAKGASHSYEFTVKNSGTNWYHCHVDSAHHVDMGMYGAFIVEPRQETIVADREYTLLLDEWPTGHVHVHHGAMAMPGHEQHGVVSRHAGTPRHTHGQEAPPTDREWYPTTYAPYTPVYDGFTINGRSFPYTEPIAVRTGERVRLRLINVGYEPHFIHTHSHKFTVVARDGQPVNEPQRIDTVEVGPAQRVDIILYADNPGIWPLHCHRLNHVTNENIYPGGMLTFIRYLDWTAEGQAGQ